MTGSFTWRDGERVIRFGRGAAAEAVDLLGGPGYALLTTPRAAGQLPAVADAAGEVHEVPGGLVDELAGDLLGRVGADRVVGLGGGRVIDTAKAVAAAQGGRAMAIPTTLSGAEMTVVHRTARGAPAGTGLVRPAVVINDPELCASQPEPELAASALNALAHAIEGPRTTLTNPVATLAAAEAVRLIDAALAQGGQAPQRQQLVAVAQGGQAPQRQQLALGALLAGYTIDSTGYGLHHVMAQTLVRVGGAPHAGANAVLLPHTARRLGDEAGAAIAERIVTLTGASRISELGVHRGALAACADAAAQRGELQMTPPPATRDEILALYEAAY